MFYKPLKKNRTILIDGDFVKSKDPPIYILGYHDEEEDVFYYLLMNSICSYYSEGCKRVVVERFTKRQVRSKVEFCEQWGGAKARLLKPILFVEFRRIIKTDRIITIDSVEEWLEFCDQKEDERYAIEIMRRIFRKG